MEFGETVMKYVFEVEFNLLLDQDFFVDSETAFSSALNCACVSIQSVLYDYPVNVVCVDKSIEISWGDIAPPFTLAECISLVGGSFRDASGKLYPEFKGVVGKSI